MSAVETLKAARAWLGEGEHRWTQGGYYGVDERGEGVRPKKAAACCAVGALMHADCSRRSFLHPQGILFLDRAAKEASGLAPEAYNDAPTTTYADILALYDRAIELAEQAEGGAS